MWNLKSSRFYVLNTLNSSWQNDQLLIMGKIFCILLYLLGAMPKHSIPLSTIKTQYEWQAAGGILSEDLLEYSSPCCRIWSQRCLGNLYLSQYRKSFDTEQSRNLDIWVNKRTVCKNFHYLPMKSKWCVKQTAYST